MSQVWLVRFQNFLDHEGDPAVVGVCATEERAREHAETWAAERDMVIRWFPNGGLLKTKPSTIDGQKPRPERMVGDIDLEQWEVIE